jgi:C4-dicarboxylate transporter, DctM subunit
MNLLLWPVSAVAVLIGLPIFLALLLGVLAVLFFQMNMQPRMLHLTFFGSLNSFTLLAIPFFLFAGDLMGRGGISRRIIEWVLALVGRSYGAMGYVTVGTSGLYGAISGSSPATVASVGGQLYPEMRKSGYSLGFSVGLINAAGAVSVVIPPSINFILYGVVAEQSIVDLFTAGILPGILLLGSLALAVAIYARRHDIREGETFSALKLWRATRSAFWSLLMPVFVLGAIYGGFATPTEAGGFACVYAIVLTVFVYREISLRQVVEIAGRSALLTAQIMVIVAAAGVFSWILTVSGFQTRLSTFVTDLDVQPWMVLLAINVLLLIIGCFIDPTSAILTLTPLLLPIALQLGVDPIHFGVVMSVNLSIGMFTPPFGLNLFVTQAVLKIRTAELYRGVLPFAALQILMLLVITYVPTLSTFLIR